MQIVSSNAKIGKNVTLREGVIIEDNVVIGDDSYIDYNTILRENVTLGANSFVGANCILGEFHADFISDRERHVHVTQIGTDAVIRSGTILYGDISIGDFFQSGHRITIREGTRIGDHVSIGTLSDIHGHCEIGNHVRLHSSVHIGQKTIVKDYAWIFPYVVTTNDPTPPSHDLLGVTVEEYACVCTGAIILPGKVIGRDSIVGAGALVTKDVAERAVVIGNPAKYKCQVEDIKDLNGEPHYPWRDYYFRK
jgi:acetyltransferase-like isoleucine patch superfamily enzyme